MAFPYYEAFLGLLLAYMVYSVWARLDGRYPIAGALVLLIAAAVSDAVGNASVANTLAVFTFFLLAGGVVLLLIEHVREERARPMAEPPARTPPPDRPAREPEVQGAGDAAAEPPSERSARTGGDPGSSREAPAPSGGTAES